MGKLRLRSPLGRCWWWICSWPEFQGFQGVLVPKRTKLGPWLGERREPGERHRSPRPPRERNSKGSNPAPSPQGNPQRGGKKRGKKEANWAGVGGSSCFHSGAFSSLAPSQPSGIFQRDEPRGCGGCGGDTSQPVGGCAGRGLCQGSPGGGGSSGTHSQRPQLPKTHPNGAADPHQLLPEILG